MEFTQYHDVYYNTGDGAETQDLECKERKDKLVGMARETGCTISAVAQPQRLKVEKKTSSTSRRSRAPQLRQRRQAEPERAGVPRLRRPRLRGGRLGALRAHPTR